MPTKQETFDTVVAHLRRQGQKSEFGFGNKNIGCAYRGENGLVCAAGCLIPDALYSPKLEGTAVAEDSEPGELIISLGHNVQLVRDLQDVHDKYPVDGWEGELSAVAHEHGLVYSPLIARLIELPPENKPVPATEQTATV